MPSILPSESLMPHLLSVSYLAFLIPRVDWQEEVTMIDSEETIREFETSFVALSLG